MLVPIVPGWMIVTCTPKCPASNRIASLSISRAALEAEYTPSRGGANRPAGEEMFRMRPEPRSRIVGSAACITRSGPSTLVASTCSTRSAGTASTGPLTVIAALLMTTSSLPAAAIASAIDAGLVRSRTSRSVAGRSARSASRRPVATTSWPRRLSSLTKARPSPRVAPVTRIRDIRCSPRRDCQAARAGGVRRVYPGRPAGSPAGVLALHADRGRPFRSRVLSTISTASGSPGCRAQPSWRYQTRLGRRLRLELVGELADLGRRVAPVATKGLQERELALLGPSRHGLGRHVQDVGHLGGMEITGTLGCGLAAGSGCHGASLSFGGPEYGAGPGVAEGSSGHHRRDRRQRRCWRHAPSAERTGRACRPTHLPAIVCLG